MICAKQVFRCFKKLERAGDALTGAAGPLFVFLAVLLLSIGAFCFCEHRVVFTPPVVLIGHVSKLKSSFPRFAGHGYRYLHAF